MLAEQQNSVDDWVNFLGKEHMPAMAETVQKLKKLTTDDDSRVSQLTEQILKDPSLTSRVLQVVNSAIYKGYGGNIKTITRAIVMMGFNAVRDTTMSMQLLDKILKHNPSEHLMMQIANSFHAAMQARGLLKESKTEAQEEIFISTLLLHFAEMSLLSRDDEISRKLNMVLRQGDISSNEAAKEVLGCGFDEISLALAKQWDLSDVLVEALSKPSSPSKPAQAVLLGDELSQVAMLGWNSKQVEAVIKKIAKFRDISVKDAMQEVKQMADSAQEMATHYGAAKVRHLIPTSETGVKKAAKDNAQQGAGNGSADTQKEEQTEQTVRHPAPSADNEQLTVGTASEPAPAVSSHVEDEGIEDLIEMALTGKTTPTERKERAVEIGSDQSRRSNDIIEEHSAPPVPAGVGDVQMQMDIMAKLNELIAEKKLNVNEMLDLVLSGMCAAIGLDRVVMSLMSRDRRKLVPKFFKGMVDQQFKERLALKLDEENAFSASISQSQQLWIGSKLMAGRSYLHTKQLQKALGCGEYFIAPIIVSRRPIGVFYGDKAITKIPLNDQQYAGFNMLAQQAGMALTASQK